MTRKYDLPRNNCGRRWITTITYSLLHNSNLLLSVTMDTAPRFSLILITSFITRNRHLDSSFLSYHLLQSWNLISRYVSLYHLPIGDKKKKEIPNKTNLYKRIFTVETKRRINIAKEKKSNGAKFERSVNRWTNGIQTTEASLTVVSKSNKKGHCSAGTTVASRSVSAKIPFRTRLTEPGASSTHGNCRTVEKNSRCLV